MGIFGSTLTDTDNQGIDEVGYGTLFNLSKSVSADSMSGYIDPTGNVPDVRFAIYSSDGNLIAETVSVVSTADDYLWITSSFSSGVSLSAGNYYLCAATNARSVDVGTNSTQTSLSDIVVDSSVHFESSFTDTTEEDDKACIYCTYSTDISGDITAYPNTAENISLALDVSLSTGSLTEVSFTSVTNERYT